MALPVRDSGSNAESMDAEARAFALKAAMRLTQRQKVTFFRVIHNILIRRLKKTGR
jgi:hypothetical protein